MFVQNIHNFKEHLDVISCLNSDTTVQINKVWFESELYGFYVMFTGKTKTLVLPGDDSDKIYIQESLFRACFMPGIMLSARDTKINKTKSLSLKYT